MLTNDSPTAAQAPANRWPVQYTDGQASVSTQPTQTASGTIIRRNATNGSSSATSD